MARGKEGHKTWNTETWHTQQLLYIHLLHTNKCLYMYHYHVSVFDFVYPDTMIHIITTIFVSPHMYSTDGESMDSQFSYWSTSGVDLMRQPKPWFKMCLQSELIVALLLLYVFFFLNLCLEVGQTVWRIRFGMIPCRVFAVFFVFKVYWKIRKLSRIPTGHQGNVSQTSRWQGCHR